MLTVPLQTAFIDDPETETSLASLLFMVSFGRAFTCHINLTPGILPLAQKDKHEKKVAEIVSCDHFKNMQKNGDQAELTPHSTFRSVFVRCSLGGTRFLVWR